MRDIVAVEKLDRQLSALAALGVPLGLRDKSGPGLPFSTEPVHRLIAPYLAQGESLASAVHKAPIDPAYRALLLTELRPDQLPRMLETLGHHADLLHAHRRQLRTVAIYPFLILALAGLGFAAYLLLIFPLLERTYFDLDVPRLAGIRVVSFLREAPWIWAWIPCVAGLAGLWQIWVTHPQNRTTANRPSRWPAIPWPGLARITREIESACFVDLLANQREAEVPYHVALPIAAQLSGQRDVLAQVSPFNADSEPNLVFPGAPFLTWAVARSDDPDYVPRLRTVASIYRTTAQSRMTSWQSWIPSIACLGLAGVVTLLYALALFVPLIQLLQQLTLPTIS